RSVDAKALWKDSGHERADGAIPERRSDAHRDEREHVWAAVHERRPGAHEEWPARPEHNRSGEHEAYPVDRALSDESSDAPSRDRIGHAGDHDRGAKDQRDPEAPSHVDEFRVRGVLEPDHAWLEGHPANRT